MASRSQLPSPAVDGSGPTARIDDDVRVSSCAACSADGLLAHLRVAGEMGQQGLIPTTDAFGTALSDIVRCPGCSHMQLARFPSQAELGAAYGEAASEDYVEEEAGQRATARAVLEYIERAAPTRGRILDLGCWVGFLLDEARRRGWQPVGVEPSAFAAGFARERLDLPVVRGDLMTAAVPNGSFSAAVLGDVIEHLPDPGAALERIARLLVDDGVLALMLPDAGSRLARRMGARWWSVIPTHVQYFTRASLRTLLERHGYEPLLVTTQAKAFTVRYYLDRLRGYSPALAEAAIWTATRAGLADRLWAPDFRDRMLVVARRSAANPGGDQAASGIGAALG